MSMQAWRELAPDAEVPEEEEIYGGNSINDPNPSGNPDEDDDDK